MLSYKGQRIFILGSGPSLKGFDFSVLDNELTLALNHTVRYYNKAKMLLFMDRRFVQEWESGIDNFQGEIFFRAVADYQRKGDNIHPFAINKQKPQTDFNQGLYMGENAGLAALNLALILGCSPIYLMGFDIAGGYFFTDEFKEEGRQYAIDKQERVIKLFDKFSQYKEIYNCSKTSILKVFPKVDIKDIL